MVRLINDGNYDKVWIAPPEIVDYDNFSGFVYKVEKEIQYFSELDISKYIEESKLKKPVTIDMLEKTKIQIYDGGEQNINAWPVLHCMNCEISWGEEIYILNDGKWYRVDIEFSNAVNQFFDSLSESEIEFPPYNDMHEGDYLRFVAKDEGFALLDQQWIFPKGTRAGYRLEFCDLLYRNAFIHVKKDGSASVLSHLFSQASVATDLLMNDSSVQEQVNEHLKKVDLKINFNSQDSPRKYKIVLAIMQKSEGKLHLPFFSKVNLRHHVRRLRNMGFEVELAKIPLKE